MRWRFVPDDSLFMFMDDMAILLQHVDKQSAEIDAIITINTVATFSQVNKPAININKTNFMQLQTEQSLRSAFYPNRFIG